MQEECSFPHFSAPLVIWHGNEVILLLKFESFPQNCVKNGGICVHWCILNVMLGIVLNLLMFKLIDTSAFLGMSVGLYYYFWFGRKSLKHKWLIRTFG